MLLRHFMPRKWKWAGGPARKRGQGKGENHDSAASRLADVCAIIIQVNFSGRPTLRNAQVSPLATISGLSSAALGGNLHMIRPNHGG
jgi:hypothetical protein